MTSICVLTGAGLSTASGIPDFRGPGGIWTEAPETAMLFDYELYLADPQIRRASWLARKDSPAWTADPNPAHQALVELEKSGLMSALITQNIDRLHHFAGSDAEFVIELHGNMFDAICLSCGKVSATAQALARLEEGDDDPRCTDCGGILKTHTVMFGENVGPAELKRAAEAAGSCTVFAAIGTSLQVQPAAGLVGLAHRAGAEIIIVNAEPTPADHLAHRVERGDIAQVVPELVREWIAAG